MPRSGSMADCSWCDDHHPRGAPECPGHRVGTTIAGKYRVHAVLGMGGMGAVYRADHIGLGRPVALKLMHREISGDAEMAGRFSREARELAALGHRGIVDVRDTGVAEDGGFYIEMELLTGRDLRSLLREGPLPVDRAVAIAIEVLDALATVHGRGVIHRDLKSPNVFLARDGDRERVVLLDFGFAKANDAQQLTQPGELLGSPLYMSPEQCRDPASVDARADLFSLGVILFEMLTGTWPYAGRSFRELTRQILRGEIQRRPAELRPDVPAWLDDVVARNLAFERNERHPSAEAMKTALSAGPPPPPKSLISRLLGRS